MALLVVGCAGASGAPAPRVEPPARSTVAGVSNTGGAASPARGPLDAGPASCGALRCRLFDSSEQAFAVVLEDDPLVLALGESHALRGTSGVESTTIRFARDLLPSLAGRASDLVLELWRVDEKCKKDEVARVAERQHAVTERQASTNQNEFVALGNESRRLGIRLHVLWPSCSEYDAILAAGLDGVARMLEMIARLTAAKVEAILERNRRSRADRMVVTYGGAMHNDVEPRSGRERWSFGPELAERTEGRYVELDLIVPEFVKDTAAWRAQPWYPFFDPDAHPDRVTLYRTGLRSYALIFRSSSAAR